jgi:predicted nucleic acid-binding protein
MKADCFVDTNVLLYAVSGDRSEAAKAEKARRILAREDFGLSTQVVQEFFVNATQKIARPLTDEEALEFIDIIALAPIIPIELGLVIEAVAYKKQYGISYWDAAIVAGAHALGASVLYTEDLAHDVTYGSVRAKNPFV